MHQLRTNILFLQRLRTPELQAELRSLTHVKLVLQKISNADLAPLELWLSWRAFWYYGPWCHPGFPCTCCVLPDLVVTIKGRDGEIRMTGVLPIEVRDPRPWYGNGPDI